MDPKEARNIILKIFGRALSEKWQPYFFLVLCKRKNYFMNLTTYIYKMSSI